MREEIPQRTTAADYMRVMTAMENHGFTVEQATEIMDTMRRNLTIRARETSAKYAELRKAILRHGPQGLGVKRWERWIANIDKGLPYNGEPTQQDSK